MTSHPFLGRSRTITDSRVRDHISTDTFFNRLLRRSSPSSSSNTAIELAEEIDVNRNLELYNNSQIEALNTRILYEIGPLSINTVLLRSSREEILRVVEQTTTLDLLNPETIVKLKQSKKLFVHIGLVVIGIKGLTRKELGTKVLLLLLDKSWIVDIKRAIISGMEKTEKKKE